MSHTHTQVTATSHSYDGVVSYNEWGHLTHMNESCHICSAVSACTDRCIYMYMWIYVYTYIYEYIYTYTHIHIYMCIYVYTYMRCGVSIYWQIDVYIYVYIWLHVYTYTHTHIYTHICVYMFIHIYTFLCLSIYLSIYLSRRGAIQQADHPPFKLPPHHHPVDENLKVSCRGRSCKGTHRIGLFW